MGSRRVSGRELHPPGCRSAKPAPDRRVSILRDAIKTMGAVLRGKKKTLQRKRGRPRADAANTVGRPGQPASSAGSVGPEALIQLTCEMLTRIPPGDVTRAAVARHAGVDPALIRYYFKNR